MGCASSRAVESGDLAAPAAAPGSKAETTRSRRLSYSVEARAGLAHAEAVVTRAASGSAGHGTKQQAHGAAAGPGGPAKKHLSPTRSRRLSTPHVHTCADEAAADASGSLSPAASPRAATQNAPGPGPPTPDGGAAVRLAVACVSRTGREPGYKKINQDCCFAYEEFGGDAAQAQALWGVCDGHGPHGHLVAAFVRAQLPRLLMAQLRAGRGARDALSAAFLEVDAGLAGGSGVDCQFSGCTCAIAFLRGRTLTTAWVGDSRMVLGRDARQQQQQQRGEAPAPASGTQGGGAWGFRGRRLAGLTAVDLSVDHKPTLPEELSRITAADGRVERLVDEDGAPMGPHRVWLRDAWLPGLAMSRALGDQLAHTVGVSSEPQCMSVALTPADKLLLLASDGVWEFISSQEALDIAAAAGSPDEAARALVDAAHRRWQAEEDDVADDITAVVVALGCD